MLHVARQAWNEEDGVLSFEWVVLATLVVIGVVGGLAAARDAITDELGDAAEAMLALDNSYTIDYPLLLEIDTDPGDGVPGGPVGLASDSSFIDVQVFSDCARVPQELAP
jgi:hypothetical protein